MRTLIATIALTLALVATQTTGTPIQATQGIPAQIDPTSITMPLSNLQNVIADAF